MHAAVGQDKPTYKPQSNHHKIKKFDDLKYAMQNVSKEDWEVFCRLLNVDEATVTDLKSWESDVAKREFCLQVYLHYGVATWENIMKVVASSPLNQVATAKEIGRKHGIDYYAAVGQDKPKYSPQSNHHKIKKFSDLKHAVWNVSKEDWEVFCRMLNVDEATVTDLKRWESNVAKREFCLRDYLQYGVATWENILQVVAKSPLYQVATAKEIGRKYGIDYYAAVGQDKPTNSLQPNHHRIKKFDHLKSAVLSISKEDWEVFCRLLNVDEATVTDLKRWESDVAKLEFCLRDYLQYGVATWENLMKVVASRPLNQVITAEMIGRKHSIDYYAVVGRDKSMYSLLPNHHKIKIFDVLKRAVLSVPKEDWAVFCQLLNVDDATIADLKRDTSPPLKWEVCLRDYLQYGRDTWKRIIQQVVDSSTSSSRSIDFHAVLDQDEPIDLSDHEKLKNAMLSFFEEEWELFCDWLIFGVDGAILTNLKHWERNASKLEFCLRDYFRYGIATWENIMTVVASSPLNQVVTAKEIGRKRGIDYYAAVGQDRPTYSLQSSHHKIKKFDKLKHHAVRSVSKEDWALLCLLLNVDEATMTDLKHWQSNSEKWEFCLRDYFQYGVATWENIMKVVASSPLNQVATAKEIGRKYGIDYADMALAMDNPTHLPKPHKIRSFNDLKDAMQKIAYKDWEILCRLLNMTGAAMANYLEHWESDAAKWKFCLREYFETESAAWKQIHVLVAKKIARDRQAAENDYWRWFYSSFIFPFVWCFSSMAANLLGYLVKACKACKAH